MKHQIEQGYSKINFFEKDIEILQKNIEELEKSLR